MVASRDPRDALYVLERDQARWEAVLESARDAIIGIDPGGTVTVFNRAAQEIFGYPASDVVGRNVSMLMPSPYAEEHDGYIRAYRETKVRKAIGRVRYVDGKRQNGEVFPVELSVSEAIVGDGAVYMAIVRDVTDRRRAETELAEMRKREERHERLADIGAITAKIAHDLGNPLSGLSMQAQLILQRARKDGSQPISSILKPAEQLVAEVRRLGDLVREFLAFAREQRLELASIELEPFLREVVDLWRPVAEPHGIRLDIRGAPAVERFEADRGKLRRVLDNLVKNAIEAIGEAPGEVTITTSVSGSEKLRISIEDTGSGIPDNVQVFRLFETTKPDGSGLGLPVSKQILIAHGGNLVFEARSPRGTAFHAELPLRRRATA
jgi:two-component system sensor kinase FixL